LASPDNVTSNVPEWLENHFLPVLKKRLEAELNEDPRLFIDKQTEVGADWPETLADALNRSCCLIAIWSPHYFRSTWCLAEWETIKYREQEAGFRTNNNSCGLIYPVVFSDGEWFPEEAKRMQYRDDFRNFAYPYKQFRESQLYLEFHDRVAEVARQLVERLKQVPPWNLKWQSIRPSSTPPFIPTFQRL
jgi:hypothetical protein